MYLVQYAYLSTCLSSSSKHSLAEAFLCNNLRTAECKQYAAFLNFVKRWSKRVPTFERYKKSRNALYFTFLDYSPKYRRMLYTTNWIERLNRCYKRTLSMRGAMPNASSVLFSLGSVAMQVNKTTYSYPVSVFKDWNNDLSVHSSSFRAKESPTLEE